MNKNMHKISGEEISQFCSQAQMIQKRSYEEFIRFLGSTEFTYDLVPPDDASSAEYAYFQLDLYRLLSGKETYIPRVC